MTCTCGQPTTGGALLCRTCAESAWRASIGRRLLLLLVAPMLMLVRRAPAQTVTIRGLRLESPTLVVLEVPAAKVARIRLDGDQLIVSRVEDKEWDGPGVAILQAVFAARDPNDPPVPFFIDAPQGVCVALTALDLHGTICNRRCIHVDRRDYDLDQIPTVLDFWAFENDWQRGADFNLDGVTDVRDVIDYLSGWRE